MKNIAKLLSGIFVSRKGAKVQNFSTKLVDFITKLMKNKNFFLGLFVITIIALWSMILGWGLTKVTAQTKPSLEIAQVQSPANLELAQQLYIENCATCHLPIAAEVLPIETWKDILQKPLQHYGQRLSNLPSITIRLMWNYLGVYSRPLLINETKPQYVKQSRYFRILHYQVELPENVTSKTCLVCHPNATFLDYITTSEQ